MSTLLCRQLKAQFDVILSKPPLRSAGSGRAARSVAFFATKQRAFGSLPYQTAPPPQWRIFAIVVLGLALPWPSSVAAAQTSAPPSVQPAIGIFRIAGTVVNAVGGNSLARVRVSIQDTRNAKNLAWMITSEDGRFEFRQLPAGKYSLGGAKRGFIAASYDQHEQFSTAIVTGAGVDTEHLVLHLAPYAVLSGKVLNEAGEPVRHATVSLYVEDRRVGVGRIQRVRTEGTDDLGSYEFAALNSGTYFVAVTATPWYALHPTSFHQEGQRASAVDQSLDVAYPVTYYKDATEPDDASPIPIRGGDHLEADIHLSPVPALHLLFHVPGNGEHGFAMPMLQKPSFDGMEFVQQSGSRMVSPGVFEITGVAAGRYAVRMNMSSPGEPVQMSEVEMDLTTDGQELDAAKGEPTSSVKASVKMSGEETLPKDLGVMLRNSKLRVVAFRQVNEKGEVELPDVAPGKYEVLAQAPGKAYSVLRISSPGTEISGHILDVTAGSSLNLSLTLVGSALRVEGFAKRSGQAAPGAMVVLVPKNPETNRDLFRRDQSDLDGSFNLLNVIPGSYTVCAIENGWDLDWAKPAVIAHYCEHGRGIVVTERKQGFMQLEDAVEVQAR